MPKPGRSRLMPCGRSHHGAGSWWRHTADPYRHLEANIAGRIKVTRFSWLVAAIGGRLYCRQCGEQIYPSRYAPRGTDELPKRCPQCNHEIPQEDRVTFFTRPATRDLFGNLRL